MSFIFWIVIAVLIAGGAYGLMKFGRMIERRAIESRDHYHGARKSNEKRCVVLTAAPIVMADGACLWKIVARGPSTIEKQDLLWCTFPNGSVERCRVLEFQADREDASRFSATVVIDSAGVA